MPRPVRLNAGSPGKNSVACPICGRQCSSQQINAHLDKCLSQRDSSPSRKRLRPEPEPEPKEDKEPVKHTGKLNPEWAAILKSPPSKSDTPKSEKKKLKKSSKKSSSGSSNGASPAKKAKTEKGEKKKKKKKKHKEKGTEDDVFNFDKEEEQFGTKQRVATNDTTPKQPTSKPLTPSKTQTVNDKNANPSPKKSPSVSFGQLSNKPSPSPKPTGWSFSGKSTPQSAGPNFQAGKPTIQTTPKSKSNSQSSAAGKSNVPSPQTAKASLPSSQQSRPDFRPLAERMRPYTMDTLIGQNKALGASGTLRRLLDSGNIPSMIFWGPPGCGKTSLANVIARQAKVKNTHRFITLSATTSNVNDVKSAVEIARNEQRMTRRKTILFIDEIHRFNKTQQDAFLLHVENGTIILIGATTENPSFRVNSALLSRCRVVVLEKLTPPSITQILERALKECQVNIIDDPLAISSAPSNTSHGFSVERPALFYLANLCDGDARSALNSLEMVLDVAKDVSSSREEGAPKVLKSHVITSEHIKDSMQRAHISYDKAGEEHYNCISALTKSIRGSDTNAALYWLGRMLIGGEDPMFIARRLIVCASEDVGLADAQALMIAVSTYHACHCVGMPECELNLAHCVTYLSRAAKSRQVCTAYSRVKDCIQNHQGPTPSVPLHLQTPATKYQLAHNTLGSWGKGRKMAGGYQGFMPESLSSLDFFSTTS